MSKRNLKNALKTRVFRYDFPEFTVGTAEYGKGPTGCTAVLFPSGAQVAYDARGGAVAARETLSADPLNEWGECDGIVFAGGSTYGLDAAGGVMRRILDARGTVDSMEIPSVPSAVVYDFSGRDNQILPDAELGKTAFDGAAPNKVLIGRAGAGANTTVGSFFGDEYAQTSGQGAAFLEVGGIKVFALAVVNALGNIRDRKGRFVAGGRAPGEIDILDIASHLYGLIEKENGHAYDAEHKPAITPVYDAKDVPEASLDGPQKQKAVKNVGATRVAAGGMPKKAYRASPKGVKSEGELRPVTSDTDANDDSSFETSNDANDDSSFETSNDANDDSSFEASNDANDDSSLETSNDANDDSSFETSNDANDDSSLETSNDANDSTHENAETDASGENIDPGSSQKDRKGNRKGPGKATTLSVVVTNVALNRLELKRVAVMAHAALGRIIDPFHTPEDGDIVYACSTASMKLPGETSVADVGVLAGRCLQDAVLSTFSV
ncbi:MAG: hypothetical protein GY822_08470 [Deltaproteobacteria bacterium]|nr:hypothetical protein [Deltaproteobacteria bacterium]